MPTPLSPPSSLITDSFSSRSIPHSSRESEDQIRSKISSCMSLIKDFQQHNQGTFSSDILFITTKAYTCYCDDYDTVKSLTTSQLLSYLLFKSRCVYSDQLFPLNDLNLLKSKLELAILYLVSDQDPSTLFVDKWHPIGCPSLRLPSKEGTIFLATYQRLLAKIPSLISTWDNHYQSLLSQFHCRPESSLASSVKDLASTSFLLNFSNDGNALSPADLITLLLSLRLTSHLLIDADLNHKTFKSYCNHITSQKSSNEKHQYGLHLVFTHVLSCTPESKRLEKLQCYDTFFQTLVSQLFEKLFVEYNSSFSTHLFNGILPPTTQLLFQQWLLSCRESLHDHPNINICIDSFRSSLQLLQQDLEILAIQYFIKDIPNNSPESIFLSIKQAIKPLISNVPITSIPDLKEKILYFDLRKSLNDPDLLRDCQRFNNQLNILFQNPIGSYTFILNSFFDAIFSSQNPKNIAITIALLCDTFEPKTIASVQAFHANKKHALSLVDDTDTAYQIRLLQYYSFENIIPLDGPVETLNGYIEFYTFKNGLTFKSGSYTQKLQDYHYPDKTLDNLKDLESQYHQESLSEAAALELLNEGESQEMLGSGVTKQNKKKKKKKKPSLSVGQPKPTENSRQDREKITANWKSEKQTLQTIAKEHLFLLLLTSDKSVTELFQSIKAALGSSDDSLTNIDFKNSKMSDSDLSTSLTNIKKLTNNLLESVYRSYYDKIQTFISEYPSDGLDIVNYYLARIIFEHPITNFKQACILPEKFNLLKKDVNPLKYFFSSCTTLLEKVIVYRDVYDSLCSCSNISNPTGYPSELTIPSFENLLMSLLTEHKFFYQGNQCLTLDSLKLLDHDSIDSNIPKLKNLLSSFMTTYIEQVNSMITYLNKLIDDPCKLLAIQSKLSGIKDPETQKPLDSKAIIQQEVHQLTSFFNKFQHYPDQEYNKNTFQCFKFAYTVRENSFKSITSQVN